MKIQILCSTMYGKEPLFLSKGIFINQTVVVNQCTSSEQMVSDYKNFCEQGLSKSRNRAIENSNADICLIADNDVSFKKNTLKMIEDAFLKYPEADILTFQVETPEGAAFKSYKKNFFWHNKLSLAKVSSVEIAFRRESIIIKKLKFDENFGLGSTFATGEEYIFLADAFDAGLKIGFVPEVIVYHPKESSGSQFNNLSLIQAKGAMISRVFGRLGLALCILFSLKKFKKSSFGFFKFFHTMFKGYLKVNTYE